MPSALRGAARRAQGRRLAQGVETAVAAITSSSACASKRGWLTIRTLASAFQGANTELHACFAQPGEEMFRWTSCGRSPIQYNVIGCDSKGVVHRGRDDLNAVKARYAERDGVARRVVEATAQRAAP